MARKVLGLWPMAVMPVAAACAMVALAAIGDRRNKLRFLAHDAVMAVATLDPATLAEFRWEEWWRTHRRAFTICHDRAPALVIAREYLNVGDVCQGAYHTLGYYGGWPPP